MAASQQHNYGSMRMVRCAMCNGGAPVGTSEKRDLGGSKGGIDSDGYEKENAGTVRVRQKKR